MGNPDLSPQERRGLIIFPAEPTPARAGGGRGEWWLVLVAIGLAAAMIAIAFAIR